MSSQNDPIVIKDDQEEIADFIDQAKKQQRRFKLEKAHMVSQLEVMLTVQKFQLNQDQTLAQEQLQRKIKDYFQDILDIETENFSPRREVLPDAEKIKNAIVIFGVDFLSNKNIKPMFEGFSPMVKWLDSSHCKITFPDDESAAQAIKQNLVNQMMMESEDENGNPWHQFKPYEIFNFQRHIECRYATRDDDIQGDRKSKKYISFKEKQKEYREALFSENKQPYQKYIQQLKLKNPSVSTTQRFRRNENQREGEERYKRGRGNYRDGNYRDGNDRERSRQKTGGRFNYDRRQGNYRNNRINRSDYSGEVEKVAQRDMVNQSLASDFQFILRADEQDSLRQQQNLDFTQRQISVSLSNSNGQGIDNKKLDLSMSEQEEDKKKSIIRGSEDTNNINTSFKANSSFSRGNNDREGKQSKKNAGKNKDKKNSNNGNPKQARNNYEPSQKNNRSYVQSPKTNQNTSIKYTSDRKQGNKHKSNEVKPKEAQTGQSWKFKDGKVRVEKPKAAEEKQPFFDY